MDRCQHCQAQLLDYLYDLLDEPEQRALEAHVAGCALCQQALALARRQQELLASAARLECAPASFTIPQDETVPETETVPPREEPAVLPLPVRPPRPARRFWQPWVAAAATLLVLAGAGLFLLRDQSAARAQVAWFQEQWQANSAELAANFQRQADVGKQHASALKALERREQQEELRLQVTGPQVLGGKGTAPFRAEVTDLEGKRLDAEVSARLVRRGLQAEATKSVALEQGAEEKKSFHVPQDARLEPGEDYQLVVHAKRQNGASIEVPVSVEVAPRQFVTYLTTDRPVYQAGLDVVYFRSLTLDRRTLRPVTDELFLQYFLCLPGGQEMPLVQGVDRLRKADDEKVLRGPDNEPLRGIGAGSVPLDITLPAGEYTLTVRELRGRIPETRTRFLVRKEGAVRLESGWQWHRPEYSAGQEILASGKLIRATGEPLRGKLVTVSLVSEGRVLAPAQMLTTDGEGRLRLQSRLPANLGGPATLVLSLQDGASRDELRAAVPVHLPGAVVEFYPEGGDLIAGLESHVYFQARDKRGRPVVLVGELLENDQPTGIAVRSVTVPELGPNSGLGSFSFTPKAGARYRVRVDAPIETPAQVLPPVLADGVVLSVRESVREAGQPLTVRVHSTADRPLQVTLTCRGQVLEVVRLQPGQNEATFSTRLARGVCRVTVHEELALQGHALPAPVLAAALAGRTDGPLAAVTTLLAGAWQKSELVPRAERLVYCQPVERLDIDLRADRLAYKAGDKARLQFSALDEFHRNVPAVAQVAIVDRTALIGVDDKLSRSLPAQAWLATELRSPELLERADALILPASASRQALDLVLATQGWRRFEPAVGESVDEERLVTAEARHLPDFAEYARERTLLEATTAEQRAELTAREAQLTATLDGLKDDPKGALALVRLKWYEENGPKLRRGLLLALGVLLVVLVLVVVGQVLLAELRRTPSWLVLAGSCASLLLLGLCVTPPPPLPIEQASRPEKVLAQLEDPGARKRDKEKPAQGVWIDDDKVEDEKAKEGKEQLEKKGLKDAAGFGLALGSNAQLADQTPLAARATGMNQEQANRALQKGKSFAPARDGGFGGQGGSDNEARRAEMDRSNGPGMDKADLFHNTLKQPGASPPMALERGGANADKKGGESAVEKLQRELKEEAKQEQAKDMAHQAFGKAAEELQLRQRMLVVRTRGDAAKKQNEAESDHEWTPTVFWHPVLILPGEGTTIEFQLGSSPTRYRIDVQVHSLDGRVGNVRKDLETTGGSK
jgi:hypothetical protein